MPSTEHHDHQQIFKAVQGIFRRDLAAWEADDYVLNGTVRIDRLEEKDQAMVLAEDPDKGGGEWFNYCPARIKVDTGSAADFVTLDYLECVGFNLASLQEIPESENQPVEGLNKAIYKSKYRVNLQWYRQGEMQMNTTLFLVVDHGPFEVLLSSRRFAEEAERHIFSLPIVRPRRTKGQHDFIYKS